MRYFWLIWKHKWFVLLAGLKVKANVWDLLIHDLSKFLPSELPHYQRQFFGGGGDPEGWAQCWLKHQNRNKHHWEYWIPRSGIKADSYGKPIPMPERYVREMIADWLGAGRAYEGKPVDVKNWPWFNKSWPKIKLRLHKDSIKIVNRVLKELGQW